MAEGSHAECLTDVLWVCVWRSDERSGGGENNGTIQLTIVLDFFVFCDVDCNFFPIRGEFCCFFVAAFCFSSLLVVAMKSDSHDECCLTVAGVRYWCFTCLPLLDG